jgi:hypothetical protein
MFWRNFWFICGIIGIIMMIFGDKAYGFIFSLGSFILTHLIEKDLKKKEEEEEIRLKEIERLQNVVDKTVKNFIENDSKN